MLLIQVHCTRLSMSNFVLATSELNKEVQDQKTNYTRNGLIRSIKKLPVRGITRVLQFIFHVLKCHEISLNQKYLSGISFVLKDLLSSFVVFHGGGVVGGNVLILYIYVFLVFLSFIYLWLMAVHMYIERIFNYLILFLDLTARHHLNKKDADTILSTKGSIF